MADLAMLARHLYMHEVLEICESVHKQMEEKQLTLYQQGDIQTVASEKNMLNVRIQGPTQGDKTTSPVVIEGTNEQQILNENNMECPAAADTHSIAIASPEQTISTQVSVQLTSDSVAATSVDGSTAVYISNISNASPELQSAVFVPAVIEVASVRPETHQIVVECLDAQPTPLINKPTSEGTDCENAGKDSEAVLKDNTLQTDVASQDSPCVQDVDLNMDVVEEDAVKNKDTLNMKDDSIPRSPNSPGEGMMSAAENLDNDSSTSSDGATDDGARTSTENAAFSVASASIQDHPTCSDGDPYKCKLRERSVEEGGYIQMHRGKERKHLARKTTHKSAVQQVYHANFFFFSYSELTSGFFRWLLAVDGPSFFGLLEFV